MKLHHLFWGGLFFSTLALISLPPIALAAQAAIPATASQTKTADSLAGDPKRAEAYFNYTMGHIAEQTYEATSSSEYATQAIEYYKRAYALDPSSPVIGERLAEMYWKAQRMREAVQEAQQILKRDPNNLPTRRLLGRIYLRSLGGLNTAVTGEAAAPEAGPQEVPTGQAQIIQRAVEQYREIYRLDPLDTESALWLARLYRLQNNHDKAEEVLRATLQADPENEPAVEQLTQLLLDESRSADAIALLEEIERRGNPSASVLDLLADAYTQAKDLAKAEQAYRKSAELDPAELRHLRGLGQTLLAEEKYSDALKVYQKIAESDGDDPETFLRLAQIYRELRQFDKAEENLLQARRRAPGSVEVIYNEAMLYESQGRFQDAIRLLSDAISGFKGRAAAAPTNRRALAILYQQLGQLYREVQNYQAAIYAFEELQRLGEEEDRRARLLIIDAYRAAKDMPKAFQAAKSALAKYPKDPGLLVSQAMLLGENGQTDEAVAILRAQLTGTETDRDTYLNMAQVYERGRRYHDAENAAHTAEALPGNPRDKEMVWFLLGAIYERQKLYDRAEEQFKKVLAINPRNSMVLNYYGYMLGDLGIRLDEADGLVKRALDEEPHNGAYLDSLGWIYYKENKLGEAESVLRKALERESHDPTIHSHLGDVYFHSGRKEQAAAEWEKSLVEWRRALPTELETDKVAELEKKLSQVKHHLAQQKPDGQDAKPR